MSFRGMWFLCQPVIKPGTRDPDRPARHRNRKPLSSHFIDEPEYEEISDESESVVAEQERTVFPHALEACRLAEAAERETLEVEGETDAALRATAFQCGNFARLDSVREEFESWGNGRTFTVSVCAVNPESPVCLDGEASRVDLRF